jgi:hypothetical protein
MAHGSGSLGRLVPHLASRRTIAVLGTSVLAAAALVVVGAAAQGAPALVSTGIGAHAGFAARASGSAASASTVAAAAPRGVRRTPRTAAGLSARASVGVPTATVADSAAGGGALRRNFNGTSSRDSEVTNFNLRFEPPDQGLCTGNGFVLEAVNSAFTVFTPSGGVVRGPFNVNDLFNEGALEFTSDPRCVFDATTNTWFAVVLFINADNTLSRLDLAVNSTGDPTNVWTQYRIDTSDDGRMGEPSHPGCPCLGDQPLIGIDQTNVYLSTNEFSLLGDEFNGAQIYAISKADLVGGEAQAHIVHFDNLTVGGTVAASVQPATSRGNPTAEYFLSSLDPDGAGDNRVGVWAMTNRDAVGNGGLPTLSNVVINSEPYAIPPAAKQKGSTVTLDSGDDRMQQVQFIGGEVWGELGTAVSIPGDPDQRAGAAWFAIRPRLNGGQVTGATIDRQGYVASAREYVLYPALNADSAGRAAMVFTLTSANRFASAAYAVLSARGGNFGPPIVAAPGTGPYDPKATRWGDYSYAALDPSADAVWLATEYIPPAASQTSTGRRNWGTRVLEVALS